MSVLISIDLEKAFDKVNTNKMIDTLRTLDFPGKYIYWIYNTLINRQITLISNNHSANITLDDGQPQGDILSPTLFNIYTAAIHNLETTDTQILQYADDFSILIRDRNAQLLNQKVNNFLQNLNSMVASLNFSINQNKTSYM